MSDTVIRVENLSKKYVLNHQQEGQKYKNLRDVITDGAKFVGQKLFRSSNAELVNATREEFWALKDVSFEIKQGDRVGIIGRNGAGKSTLLKILSRIMEPTSGSIRIKGRVASLLEVGTGFHAELTGRENVYLNGAILGMSKTEIQRKFDEIIAFAEVEKFLDTPVKRYSSGMYVRLAFAVAAHLEPEILIVDEVLAVGDAQFQKKCLGKMEDVGKQGRTVLFVSHNTASILSLCDRAILLNKGQCIANGTTTEVLAKYLDSGNRSNGEVIDNSEVNPDKKVKLRKLRVTNASGEISSEMELQDEVFLEIHFEVLKPGNGYDVAFEVNSVRYGCIFASSLKDRNLSTKSSQQFSVGYYVARIKLPTKIMRGGEYLVKVSSAIPNMEILDTMSEELCFSLLDASSPISKSGEGRNGSILPILEWNLISHSNVYLY